MASWIHSLVLLYVVSSLAGAYPGLARRATFLDDLENVEETYDYVIVGAGTAGLTVGDRLSESGNYTVLAIEYGYLVRDGYRPGITTYNITSQPSPELNNRTFEVGIGCIVGGSSAVNGQVFQRGTAEDYNLWGELGGNGSSWNWDSIFHYFKKGIHFTPPRPDLAAAYNMTYDADHWGQDPNTHIYATYTSGLSPSIIPMYNAMKNLPGVDVPVDGAGGENGLFWFTTSMDPVSYNRSYARTGHWDGLNRTNYQLITGSNVNKIFFDGNVAVGVQVVERDGGESSKPIIVRARKEVILGAGAIHTPQILQLSGIGDARLLKEANIPLKVDLPGVGSNFQDHSYIPSLSYIWATSPPVPQVNATSIPNGFGIALGVFLGLPGISPENYEALAKKYETQDPAAYLPPDTHPTVVEGYAQQQRLYARSMRSKNVSFLEYMLSGSPTCSPQNVHPVSRGTVTINTTDPESEMLVDYRAASNPVDIDIMVENIKFFRRYMTTGELAQYNATEMTPGREYETDEELANWARGRIIPSVYHPIGTAAKMPREWGGVVDEDLLVYGVKSLSVVDASIMPTIVGSTTSMTVYAIAEKAADLIKARASTTEGRE